MSRCIHGYFLQGLIPGKNYSYRVQSGSNFSEGYEFTAKRDDEVSCSVTLNSQAHTPKTDNVQLGVHMIACSLRMGILL